LKKETPISCRRLQIPHTVKKSEHAVTDELCQLTLAVFVEGNCKHRGSSAFSGYGGQDLV